MENVLNKHEDVFESAVLGVHDPRRGETIMAFVAAEQESSLDEESVRSFARERLPAYKVPRRFQVVEVMPKGPTGKILKRVLREQYLDA